jgi:hypothetical protein
LREYKIFTCIDYNYRRLGLNWAKSLERINVKNYVIFSLDEKCHDFLTLKKIPSVLYKSEGINDFNKMGLYRYKILLELLAKNEVVVYSDVDAIWLGNPIPNLINLKYDACMSVEKHKTACPASVRSDWKMTICTGWALFGNSCKKLIEDFVNNFDNINEGKGNDQARFNIYLHSLGDRINPTEGHSFSLLLSKYKLKILGLNQQLVNRGKYTSRCGRCHIVPKSSKAKVLHPVSCAGGRRGVAPSFAKSTIRCLKKNGLWLIGGGK